MTKYKFLYYLSAIGQGNLDKKFKILKNNLFYLQENFQSSFDIMINCYDNNTTKLEQFLSKIDFLKNIIIYNKKGRLVELWKTNPHHDLISNYDYILYIMDDVLITNLNMSELIHIKEKYDISFLSPKVLGGSWEYMRNQNDNVLAFSNMIEFFCLLLNKNDFCQFMDIHDIENTHTWGVDLLLGHFGIKSAIYYKFCVNHMLVSTTGDGTKENILAFDEMNKYIKKHGFTSHDEILQKYPNIYSTITI